jgi:DNA-directed RNA polymerase specialized sigma24 family protein
LSRRPRRQSGARYLAIRLARCRRFAGKIGPGGAAIAGSELKKDWKPSETSFRRLLGWLDGGIDSSGESYLEMRRRLSAYFDRKGCRNPDDLADETLNRVSRRLEEEGTLSEGPPRRYCYIVAKFVFLEHVRRARHEGALEVPIEARGTDPAGNTAAADDSPGLETRLSCLDRCLGALPARDRELILDYYSRGTEGAAARRRELAVRLGLTPNALAVRACRIRGALERCVRSCEAG